MTAVLDIIGYPDPVRGEAYHAQAPVGTTLAEIAGEAAPRLEIRLDGEPIPREHWHAVRPKAGTHIEIVAVPQAAAAASIVVSQLASAAASYMFTSAIAVSFATAAFTAVGMLAVNAIIPPQTPETGAGPGQADRYNGLTGSRNKAARFEVLPKTYGTYRFFPPLGANTYTESHGQTSYMRMLLCLNGVGSVKVGGRIVGPGYSKATEADIDLSAIEIGDTSLAEYEDFELELGTIDQLTLYTNDVTETRPSAALNWPGGSGDSGTSTDNVSAVRSTAEETDEISIDIHFPQGFWTMGSDGHLNSGDYVKFSVEYAPKGTTSWTTLETFTVTRQRDPFTVSKRYNLGGSQYDVRVTRVETYWKDAENQYLDATWTALRSIKRTQPWDLADSTLLALRIKGTDQLNGVIDRLSVLQQSVLPVWDGSAWSEQPTNNPAWAYADILRGDQVAHPAPDDRIDLAAIKDWADWCDANGWEYNWVHDRDETMTDRLRAIASAGRASRGVLDGTFTVVRDSADKKMVQVLTPRNSWGYKGTKEFVDLPHAFKVRYIDPNTWQQAERIVYDDGYDETNATQFEVLETQGCTSAAQAHREGRYYLAAARLRPETHTLHVPKALRATRGDRVGWAHDVMLVGLAWGRVKSVSADGLTVTVDEELPMESGKSYVVRAQLSDGETAVETVVTDPGRQTTITLQAAISGLQSGNLLAFGEAERSTIDALITKVEYAPDLSAKVTLVDYAPEIQDADKGEIPDYDPQITTPPEFKRPAAPEIISLTSNSQTLIVNDDGTFSPGINVSLVLPSGIPEIGRQELRYGVDGQWHREQFSTDQALATLTKAPPGRTVTVEARSQSIYGVWGRWGSTAKVDTVGPSAVPQDVAGFALAVSGDSAVLSWDAARDVDVITGGHVRIWHSPDQSATSITGASLLAYLPGTATTASVPLLAGTYFAQFEDAGKRRSRNATRVVTSAPSVIAYNAVETLSEGPGWAGTTDAGAAIGVDGALKLQSANTIGQQTTKVSEWPSIVGLDGLADSGEYISDIIDLGARYATRIRGSIQTATSYTNDFISLRGLVSNWATVSGEITGPDAYIDVATSDDGAAWSNWSLLTVGTYQARYFKFRVRLATDHYAHQIEVSELTVTLDMPDRVAGDTDVAVPAGGLTVTFASAFYIRPAIGITAEDLQPGERAKVTNQSRAGFTVQVLDSSDAGVARTIDWIAKGYGAESV